MYYGSPEDQYKSIENIIVSCRTAANFAPEIKRILESFDGKVFNCRLENALKEISPYIYAHKRFKWLEIYYYGSGNNQHTLCSIELEKMIDGKRIPASLLIEDLYKQRVKLLKEANELDQARDIAPMVKTQIQYYINQIRKLQDSVPYQIREIYNINTRIY